MKANRLVKRANGMLLILALLVALAGCGREDGRSGPSIVLVIIDTLRADHVHCYGYVRENTPCMDSLASRGTMWANVQAQSSWTLPAMASIFTGTSERSHRAGMIDESHYGVSDSLEFLPEILDNSGFSTCAIFNVAFMSPKFGFDRGFDFGEFKGCSLEAMDADEVVDSFVGWMERRDSSNSFFAVLHFFDPHFPYDPPEGFRGYRDPAYRGYEWGTRAGEGEDMIEAFRRGEMGEDGLQYMIDSYDGEIAFLDSELSRLCSWLRAEGLADSTLIIVIADHGEEFGEHGMLLHGNQLYNETTRVPLIASGPGVPEGIVDSSLVGQIDILPTILAYLDLPIPSQAEGLDILREEVPLDRELPCSGFNNDISHYVAIRRNNQKLFWHMDSDSAYTFDLRLDPGETQPGPPDSTLVEAALDYWSRPSLYTAPEIPGGEIHAEKLRDLGYM